VTGGNIGQCTGTLNTPGKFAGLAATSSAQCAGAALNSAAWAGHVNTNPAMNCYLSVLGGKPDGTGSVLAFDAKVCYGGGTVSQNPAPPTGLSLIVNTN
jgi:hypothetical protein